MTRRKLRDLLVRAGLRPAANKYDGEGFHLVEFVEYWGVAPDFTGDTAGIRAALEAAGVEYEVGGYVMVRR